MFAKKRNGGETVEYCEVYDYDQTEGRREGRKDREIGSKRKQRKKIRGEISMKEKWRGECRI